MDSNLTLRRLRKNPILRDALAEVDLQAKHFIQPLFVVEGLKQKTEIPGLTDNFRETTDTLLKQIENDLKQGVHQFLLFGVPAHKQDHNFSADFTASQIERIKSTFKNDLLLSVDVCLCSHTTHGHCGILNDAGDHVENAETVDVLADFALQYAQAGADCIAPSDMMDGRIAAIKETLSANFSDRLVMSYSSKFHSNYYGPFRVAADSAPKGVDLKLKDRATYQIDPRNASDAILSSLRDYEEGADILMVKPGIAYLDILYRLSQQISVPWAVYQVSGEFAGLELLSQAGLANRAKIHLETWTSFRRAGASLIISYGARHFNQLVKGL